MSRVPAECFPPSEIIREELAARGWDAEELARRMGVGKTLVHLAVSGKLRITPGLAERLETAFGSSADFWLNFQESWDQWRERPLT